MRITRQSMWLAASAALVAIAFAGETTYEYDSNNRLKSASYPNGITANYKYDLAHNMTGIGQVLDEDDDGLPDYWEIKYFGDIDEIDGTEDSDGDGLTDLEEYLAGSDPTSASSSFVFVNSSPNPTTNTLRWASSSNRTYTIHYTTNLMQSFSVLESGIEGTPPVNEYKHYSIARGDFYRIELETDGGAE